MAVTEEGRHRLYRWVEASAGKEVANTMMELLPPVGWADVATKSDLAEQDRRLDGVEERLELRIDAARHELRAEFQVGIATLQREMRLQLLGMIGAIATVAGIVSQL